MGTESKDHIVVYNEKTKETELIDVYTGEVVGSDKYKPAPNEYVFDYKKAMYMCQLVSEGWSIKKVSELPTMPDLHVLNSWIRRHEMLRIELDLARKMRGEYYHDEVADIAQKAKDGEFVDRQELAGAKLAVDQFKWLAEKNNPERYASKVTHEGSQEKPIVMRVINTGINRKPDVETQVIRRGNESE